MIPKRIAILTSGGDAPGMNAVICGLYEKSKLNNFEIVFVKFGFQGLLNNSFHTYKNDFYNSLKEYKFLSGSFIKSSRCLEFQNSEESRKKSVENLKKNNISVLVVVGGNGSYKGAELIKKLGFPVITAPGTIDNDVNSSIYTIGFFSAMNEICCAIKKIKSTSSSHSQITFVETMGRDCKDLSIFSSVASSADYVITNKNYKNIEQLIEIIKNNPNPENGMIFVVTEKIYGLEFPYNLPSLKEICKIIEKKINKTVRHVVLGHTQRGATPTSWEIYVATGFGHHIYSLIKDNIVNVAVGFDGKNYYNTELSIANSTTLNKKFHNNIDEHNKLYCLK